MHGLLGGGSKIPTKIKNDCFKMQPKMVVVLVLGTTDHLEFSGDGDVDGDGGDIDGGDVDGGDIDGDGGDKAHCRICHARLDRFEIKELLRR